MNQNAFATVCAILSSGQYRIFLGRFGGYRKLAIEPVPPEDVCAVLRAHADQVVALFGEFSEIVDDLDFGPLLVEAAEEIVKREREPRGMRNA